MSIREDHVQLIADISKHGYALAEIALRLDSRVAYEEAKDLAQFMSQLVDLRMREERGNE